MNLDFSDEEIRRYSRNILLQEVGGTGQAKLKAARERLGEVRYQWRRHLPIGSMQSLLLQLEHIQCEGMAPWGGAMRRRGACSPALQASFARPSRLKAGCGQNCPPSLDV